MTALSARTRRGHILDDDAVRTARKALRKPSERRIPIAFQSRQLHAPLNPQLKAIISFVTVATGCRNMTVALGNQNETVMKRAIRKLSAEFPYSSSSR